jgi:hypothetical protein
MDSILKEYIKNSTVDFQKVLNNSSTNYTNYTKRKINKLVSTCPLGIRRFFVSPENDLVFKIFKDLPERPAELRQ